MANTRPRAFAPRCKSGCNTCKIRKIKCGEERPHCMRCVKSGWKCDGYGESKIHFSAKTTAVKSPLGVVPNVFLRTPSPSAEDEEPAASKAREEVERIITGAPLALSRRRRISVRKDLGSDGYSISSATSSPISTPALSPTIHVIPFQIPGTPSERQLLQYLCIQAAPDLSGCWSSNFWNSLVLPSCHHVPAIRHAALALSALHKEYAIEGITKPGDDQINSNALQQYIKALHYMQEYLSSKEPLDEKTVLIGCKLFYCIEIARQDYKAALRHVKSGLRILKDWKAKQKKQPLSNMNSGPTDDVNDLIENFSHLDVQIRVFEKGQLPYLGLATSEERLGLVPCVPLAFHLLSDVWTVTNKLVNWGFHFLGSSIERKQGMPEDTEIGNLSEMAVFEKELDRWSTAFETFMRNHHANLSSLDLESATTASLVHRATKVMVLLIAERKSPFELHDDFEDMLNMAEMIITYHNVNSMALPRSFTFETGPIATLWLLAMSCQNHDMTARAVRLMDKWPRREGLWDGARVSGAVEKAQRAFQSYQFPTQVPNLRRDSSANREGEGEGERDFYIYSFSKIFGAIDGKERSPSEERTVSPEVISEAVECELRP